MSSPYLYHGSAVLYTPDKVFNYLLEPFNGTLRASPANRLYLTSDFLIAVWYAFDRNITLKKFLNRKEPTALCIFRLRKNEIRLVETFNHKPKDRIDEEMLRELERFRVSDNIEILGDIQMSVKKQRTYTWECYCLDGAKQEFLALPFRDGSSLRDYTREFKELRKADRWTISSEFLHQLFLQTFH